MPTTLTDGHLRTVALVGVIGILFTACEPDVQVPDPVSNCRVKKNVVFRINVMDFDHYHPNKCPHLVDGNNPVWGFTAYYQGVESAPAANVAPGAIVFTTIENHSGEPVGDTDGTMVQWGNDVRTDLSGLFFRASVPTDCLGCVNEDIAYNMVLDRTNNLAAAEVEMPYYRRFVITVDGPTWCPPSGQGGPCQPGPGSPFSVRATVSNSGNGPYRYEWFRNGVSLGPPTLNASTLTDYAGNAGTYQRYEVAVTDTLRGRVYSQPYDVWIPYPEGGGGGCEPWMIECD